MARQIVIDPVTRIEGHAKITIHLGDDGGVEDARFHVTQFRGFEKLCEGRPFHEMPAITARICGICPVSHLIASSKACDALLAVSIPEAGARLRRVMNLGQFVAVPRPQLLPPLLARPAAGHGRGAGAAQRLRPDPGQPPGRARRRAPAPVRPAGRRVARRQAHPPRVGRARRRQQPPAARAARPHPARPSRRCWRSPSALWPASSAWWTTSAKRSAPSATSPACS